MLPVVPKAKNTKAPKGNYVYFWYKNNEIFPFYVGKGMEDRAWRRHQCNTKKLSAWCERVRATAKNFKVEIVREDLTEDGAALLESVFIDYFHTLGVILTNQISGTHRRLSGPFTLEGLRHQTCA